MPKYAYKLRFYSIKKNLDEVKLFYNKDEFYHTVSLLLGHTFIKDLKGYHYDNFYHKYIEVKL